MKRTFSQQVKDRQEYTAFLSKSFYKDLIMELERLEQIEQAFAEERSRLIYETTT